MAKGRQIRIAIVGVGNCAASLLQGLAYYRQEDRSDNHLGLLHYDLGGYTPKDIEVVAAFDIDERKVGKPIDQAVSAPPNCVYPIKESIDVKDITVKMGSILDGVSDHMRQQPAHRTFLPADAAPVDVARELAESNAEILLNYLPVGSEQATRFYAECCLTAGVSLINCIPVFIVSDPEWARRFKEKNIPCIGDDVKSQIGATIIHRTLTRLFNDRGITLDRTCQLNTGGNTDQDSPNSAGVTIDAIRCCKLARDRKIGGPLTSMSAFGMKHPPAQFSDSEANDLVNRFIKGTIER